MTSSVIEIDDRIPSSCLECRYFDDDPEAKDSAEMSERRTGLCRRAPPTAAGLPDRDHRIRGSWLTVRITDWCGAGSTGIRGK